MTDDEMDRLLQGWGQWEAAQVRSSPVAVPGHGRRWLLPVMAAAALVVLVLGISLAVGLRPDGAAVPGVTPSASPPAPSDWGAPDHFVSYRLKGLGAPADGIWISDATTGATVRRLAFTDRPGLTVNGTSLDRVGRLWVSYSRGPLCSSNIAGCGPRPDTCASEIDRFDADGQGTLIRSSSGLLGQVQVSPDGRYVAMSESPCVPSYFNDHLRVLDTRTGASWTIGESLPRCHQLRPQGWTSDSRHLLAVYAPAVGAPWGGGDGVCNEPGPRRLVVLDGGTAAPAVSGPAVPLPPTCTITSAAPGAGGAIAALADCGAGASGKALRLLRLDSRYAVRSATEVGRCSNGTAIVADRSGTRFLLTAYLYCGSGHDEPKSGLWTDQGDVLRHVRTVPSGDSAFRDLSW